MYITSKFLLFLATVCLIIIGTSIFIPNLDATGNLVTIRTLFSSIIGCILETTSRRLSCKDNIMLLKNYCIGILSICILSILILSVIFNINVNNPSLLLLKNILFSCVGFLISSTKECE